MLNPRYYSSLKEIITPTHLNYEIIKSVTSKFPFRANKYYLSLVNWDDPNDPISRIIVPDITELNAWGDIDASREKDFTVLPGLQHKYEDTALILISDECAGYCRFCFRKRIFKEGNSEVESDFTDVFSYLRSQKKINNVLLSGGDPLMLSTSKLRYFLEELSTIDHIRFVRIGTKTPAFNPFRISKDSELLHLFSSFCKMSGKKLYLSLHFNHPNELTDESLRAVDSLIKCGAVLLNQTPLLRGINDDPVILTKLFNELAYVGVTPYYLFQCRPTKGNYTFSTPIERSLEIFESAKHGCSGPARRARLVMSHQSGKVEIIGKDDGMAYFKYHRAFNPSIEGSFFSLRSNPNAHWLDDYEDFAEFENSAMAS